jgi:hypothetical protein
VYCHTARGIGQFAAKTTAFAGMEIIVPDSAKNSQLTSRIPLANGSVDS